VRAKQPGRGVGREGAAADGRGGLVRGGGQPPEPEVGQEIGQVGGPGLEAAAAGAAAHGSRALIVSRHDHIVFERYWQGSRFDTLADAQSFTPLLAALTAGAAMSHRLIGWPDEPVGAFIGEWARDPRGAITVRNLMQMSSGLAPPLAAGAEPLAAALHAPLAAKPGTLRVAQPADPQLLALVVERKHEIVTLRTIGISRGELRTMLALEAAIIAVTCSSRVEL